LVQVGQTIAIIETDTTAESTPKPIESVTNPVAVVPNVFNANEVYSFRRITLAPIVIIAGFIVEIYAIFKKA